VKKLKEEVSKEPRAGTKKETACIRGGNSLHKKKKKRFAGKIMLGEGHKESGASPRYPKDERTLCGGGTEPMYGKTDTSKEKARKKEKNTDIEWGKAGRHTNA